MTPARAAALVAWWVAFYTRSLPPAPGRRRRDEIAADVHDHIAYERERRTPDARIALALVARMARGMGADAAWRRQVVARNSTRKDRRTMDQTAYRRIALVTVALLLIPAIGMLVTEEMAWGVFDFVFAGALIAGAGLLLARASRRNASIVFALGAAALGLAAIGLGEADDAPGLVGFGCLLIIGTLAMTARTAWRGE